jgi:hypothetical protein
MACIVRDEDARDLVIFVRVLERSAHAIWSRLVDDLGGIPDSPAARTENVVNCFLEKSYMLPHPPHDSRSLDGTSSPQSHCDLASTPHSITTIVDPARSRRSHAASAFCAPRL